MFSLLDLPLGRYAVSGDNGVTALWRYAVNRGRIYESETPREGDLVFFKETYDLNRDGRRNDGLTHIGLVDSVEGDGTIVVVHRVPRGVVRSKMNLAHPARGTDGSGRVINDWLRAASAGDGGQLMGQLFAGYASLFDVAAEGVAVTTQRGPPPP